MKFTTRHTLTLGFSTQKYHSDNVFWSCCPQSAYTFNSLADFYAEASGYLANPNRTARRSRLRASRCVTRTSRTSKSRSRSSTSGTRGGYVQDEWRPRRISR